MDLLESLANSTRAYITPVSDKGVLPSSLSRGSLPSSDLPLAIGMIANRRVDISSVHGPAVSTVDYILFAVGQTSYGLEVATGTIDSHKGTTTIAPTPINGSTDASAPMLHTMILPYLASWSLTSIPITGYRVGTATRSGYGASSISLSRWKS
ncbi:hypothetical protein L218DRAFT_995683 [Marasmius fiardii PR-910]|nr:hypothetical protein L218DRAFT_995683 [Marasmius fiardii PR-910]